MWWHAEFDVQLVLGLCEASVRAAPLAMPAAAERRQRALSEEVAAHEAAYGKGCTTRGGEGSTANEHLDEHIALMVVSSCAACKHHSSLRVTI